MGIQIEKNDELVDLLKESAELYTNMKGIIDISDSDMPVTSNDTGLILFAYLLLYGKSDTRRGGFCTAKHYKSFIKRAERLAGLPEIDGLVQRIEKARSNLETSVRTLNPQDVLSLGYELRQDGERLLIYLKEAE